VAAVWTSRFGLAARASVGPLGLRRAVLMVFFIACGPSRPTDGGSTVDVPNARGGTSSSGVGAGGQSGRVGTGSGGMSAADAPTRGSVDCAHDGDGTTTLAFVNGCGHSVFFAGSDIDGGSLVPGAVRCVDIGSAAEALAAKRYWGYGGNDPGAGHYSLAEFTFNTDFHDFDWYDVSFVDAFNLPLGITPLARPDCLALACADDFLACCPAVGQLRKNV
jgi:hypothetical protein